MVVGCVSWCVQLLAGASSVDQAAAVKRFASLTPADVKAAAQAALSKPVSVGAVGNTIYVPGYAKIASKFQ